MSKVLVIPDIHGRDFWKKPCMEWKDPIIFLGDYHDPYSFECSKEQSYKNLKELVEFSKTRSNCVFLYGNHDLPYVGGKYPCRFDYFRAYKIGKLIKELNPQVSLIIDNIIFTHSGVLPKWLSHNNLNVWDIINLTPSSKELYDVSLSRGGDILGGSCVWGDVFEYIDMPHLANYYQIFGHTKNANPIIQSDFSMLDCGKCFIVDLNNINDGIVCYDDYCSSSNNN